MTRGSAVIETPVELSCEGSALLGILHAPAEPTAKPGVLVVVGGPQYRVGSHRQFVLLARALAAAGYPTLRFDVRGMGDSAGANRTFETIDADIRCAMDAMQRRVPQSRGIVLWGLCDGASAILMSHAADVRVSGVVLVNPWVRSVGGEARSSLRHYYRLRVLQPSFWRKVLSGSFNLRKSVGELAGAVGRARQGSEAGFVDRMLRGLAGTRAPVLILTSEHDLTAREFEDLCRDDAAWKRAVERSNVSHVRLGDTDHTFSDRVALDRATDLCLSWLGGDGERMISHRPTSTRQRA